MTNTLNPNLHAQAEPRDTTEDTRGDARSSKPADTGCPPAAGPPPGPGHAGVPAGQEKRDSARFSGGKSVLCISHQGSKSMKICIFILRYTDCSWPGGRDVLAEVRSSMLCRWPPAACLSLRECAGAVRRDPGGGLTLQQPYSQPAVAAQEPPAGPRRQRLRSAPPEFITGTANYSSQTRTTSCRGCEARATTSGWRVSCATLGGPWDLTSL